MDEIIEYEDDGAQPMHAALRCPYCGVEGQTTLPPRSQVNVAEIEISHACGWPWQWKVVTK